MLVRVAESHLRFGHFEHFYYRREPDKVRQLADYALRRHWPHLQNEPDRYVLWFRDVVARTAAMIARWQAVGFAHGVMNTDNMSLLGLTFDYGPYGFLDDYQPGYICNHSDYQGVTVSTTSLRWAVEPSAACTKPVAVYRRRCPERCAGQLSGGPAAGIRCVNAHRAGADDAAKAITRC